MDRLTAWLVAIGVGLFLTFLTLTIIVGIALSFHAKNPAAGFLGVPLLGIVLILDALAIRMLRDMWED